MSRKGVAILPLLTLVNSFLGIRILFEFLNKGRKWGVGRGALSWALLQLSCPLLNLAIDYLATLEGTL
jgi:hypothetical protein